MPYIGGHLRSHDIDKLLGFFADPTPEEDRMQAHLDECEYCRGQVEYAEKNPTPTTDDTDKQE